MTKAKIRILIADDVIAMRNHLRSSLVPHGFSDITSSENGQKAISLLGKQTFDLIISDWHWPSKDGLDLLEYIRLRPDLRKLPFIMVTAESSKEKVIQAIAAGVDDYLIKPVSPEVLADRIASVIVSKKARP